MGVSLNGPGFFVGEETNSLVVMLHGRGASGDNIIALAPEMSKVLTDSKFVAPNARQPYGVGYTWFSDSLKDMHEGTTLGEIMASVQLVNDFIDAQLTALGLGSDRLVLMGFSQGAMLSIYVGLTREEKCAAVVAYSGAIPFSGFLAPKIKSRPDVCVIHGERDDVIPFTYFDESVSFLRKHGVSVEPHSMKNLYHSINEKGIEIGSRFIKEHLIP